MSDTSGFYKMSSGGLLFAPNFVYSKNYTLERENPPEDFVDGWKFFQSQEEAEQGLIHAVAPNSITPRQARLALHQLNLLQTVETALQNLEEPQKSSVLIEWEYATLVKRDSPLIGALAPALGLTENQIDEIFILASTFS